MMRTTHGHWTSSTIAHVEPMLLSVALRAVRNPETARDLVQETYVAAIEGQQSFEGRSTLRTWMVGILSRKIVDHFRRGRRELLVDAPPQPDVPSSRFLRRSYPAQDRRLDQQSALRVIERSLGELGELERTAVLLCDVQQLERTTACEVLGIRGSHLRVLLHRGRHKLRRALEAEELSPGPDDS